ncbi:MAG: hypothetical protein ACUVTY_04605 [Armatimonadota bacterium]
MRKRFAAIAGVLLLAIATVLWVSANPQNKAQVKPAAARSGSCCAHEDAMKATAAPTKADVKPAALKEGKTECPYMAKAAASNGKKDCATCPEMMATAKTAAASNGNKACGSCPAMKSNGTATQAKVGAKAVSVQAKKPAKEQKAKL